MGSEDWWTSRKAWWAASSDTEVTCEAAQQQPRPLRISGDALHEGLGTTPECSAALSALSRALLAALLQPCAPHPKVPLPHCRAPPWETPVARHTGLWAPGEGGWLPWQPGLGVAAALSGGPRSLEDAELFPWRPGSHESEKTSISVHGRLRLLSERAGVPIPIPDLLLNIYRPLSQPPSPKSTSLSKVPL